MVTDNNNMPSRSMGGNFRSSAGPGGLRRAHSESTFRNDRDRDRPDYHSSNGPKKPWSSQIERSNLLKLGNTNSNIKKSNPNQQLQNGGVGKLVSDSQRPSSQQIPISNPSTPLRNWDPRFKRTESSNSNIGTDATHNRQDSSDFSEAFPSGGHSRPNPAAHSVDPFGRSRDWGQIPRSGVRRTVSASANDTSRNSASSTAPLSTNTSNNASSTANEPSVDPGPCTPLSVSSLGNAEVVKRAETVVSHLREVVSVTNTKPDTKELPSKTDITSAMTKINSLVAKTKSEAADAEQETKKAKEEEKIKRIQEAAMLEEEKKQRQLKIKQRKEDRTKEEEHSKILAEQEGEDQSEICYEAEIKKRKADLDEELKKAKEGKKILCDQELEAKVKEATAGMDESISKARNDMEKSKLAAKDMNKKLAKVEKQYKSYVENEKKKKQKKKKLVKKEIIPVEDVVNSISSENKRKAKEAHALSLSIADPHFGLHTDDFETLVQHGAQHEVRDPKYKKTFEEWSIMANQVTGLSNSLYSEPSETPYYDHNKRNHASVGLMVKEYVRDKQKRLNKHWLMLAEEYEVRKRLYEKQQRKLAKKHKEFQLPHENLYWVEKRRKRSPVTRDPSPLNRERDRQITPTEERVVETKLDQNMNRSKSLLKLMQGS